MGCFGFSLYQTSDKTQYYILKGFIRKRAHLLPIDDVGWVSASNCRLYGITGISVISKHLTVLPNSLPLWKFDSFMYKNQDFLVIGPFADREDAYNAARKVSCRIEIQHETESGDLLLFCHSRKQLLGSDKNLNSFMEYLPGSSYGHYVLIHQYK